MSWRLAIVMSLLVFARAEAAGGHGLVSGTQVSTGTTAGAQPQIQLTVEEVEAPGSPWQVGVCRADGCICTDGTRVGFLPKTERKNKLIKSIADFEKDKAAESHPFIVIVFTSDKSGNEMKAKVREMFKDRPDVAIYIAPQSAGTPHDLHQQYSQKGWLSEVPAVAVLQRAADKSWPSTPAGGTALTGELGAVNQAFLNGFTPKAN